MRRIPTTLAIAIAAVTLATTAAPALAGEFKASKIVQHAPAEFPLTLRGHGVGPQEFQFKRIHVLCQSAHAHGSIPSATSPTIALTVTYGECTTGPVVVWGNKTEDVPMRFKEKSQYTFHFNGYVNSEEEVEMKARYLRCIVDWGTGTIPEKAEEKPSLTYTAATYGNEELASEDLRHFPSGIQHKLTITNEFKGMEWEEEGGGLCEDPDIELAEGENGKYHGELVVEVPHGNIEV